MGRKLDTLLGLNFRTSKFETIAKLAISRIAILKNHRQVRCSHARSDVTELLNLGHQDHALFRVEHVIKEQNMLDVFDMIEDYCHLLIERVELIRKTKECPDELKEAVSSLICSSSRCGQFPELQEIRGIFLSRFGKEFVACAVELGNNCGVNPKMIQKLSPRQPSFEIRLKVLKEIASENGITLHLKEDAPLITKEKLDSIQKQKQPETRKSADLYDPDLTDDSNDSPEEIEQDEKFSESMKGRQKYRDVAAAAQTAFYASAYAAEAARAAVELSSYESRDNDPDDDHSGSNHHQETISDADGSSTPKLPMDGYAASEEIKHLNNGLGFYKIHPIDDFSSESEAEEIAENNHRNHLKKSEESKTKAETEMTLLDSSSDSDEDYLTDMKSFSNDLLGNKIVLNRYEDESRKKQDNRSWLKHHDLGSDRKPNMPLNKYHHSRQYDAVANESLQEKDGNKFPSQSPQEFEADSMVYPMEGRFKLKSTQRKRFVKQFAFKHR